MKYLFEVIFKIMKKLLTLAVLALFFLLSGCLPEQEMYENMSVEEVIQWFEDQDKYVITFVGFSGAGYERPDSLLEIATQILDDYEAENTILNIGATPDGIGLVYALGFGKKMTTTGIVSTQALEYDAKASPLCQHVFYIEDDSWGGFKEGTDILSPTSTAMIEVSDEVIGIGGGAVARDELMAAKALGKKVRFYDLEMNHQTAIEKAESKGNPAPTDFKGEAARAME